MSSNQTGPIDTAYEIHQTLCRRKSLESEAINDVNDLVVDQQGNFTTAIINGKHIGVTKRNPKDNINPDVGCRVAIYRAVKKLLNLQ